MGKLFDQDAVKHPVKIDMQIIIFKGGGADSDHGSDSTNESLVMIDDKAEFNFHTPPE